MSASAWIQIIYLVVLLIIGSIVLYLRRRAQGSKSVYKITLILLGVIIAVTSISNKLIIEFDIEFLKSLSVVLLIILMFELSVRLNPENIDFKKKNLTLFFGILIINVIILSILATLLLNIQPIFTVVFAIIISSIEYFMVDELKEEGDLSNPFLILFAFSILSFYNLQDSMIFNMISFIQYMFIGLGMGVAIGIIVFKCMKNQKITWFSEIALVAAAIITYILTEYIGGSGLFAILILGVFFGNSFVRKKNDMKSFSPFIFKSLEILIFLLIGFVAYTDLSLETIFYSIILYIAYLIIRYIVINITYKHYSIQNKLLLTFAPKGMVFAIMILVLGSYGAISNSLITVMLMIIIFSLIISAIFEYFENQKIHRLERLFSLIKNLRFGRKRDIIRKKLMHKTRR